MHSKQTEGPFKFSIEETEEGYAIHVKGDKEKLKAKLEALEAYQNFRQKAKAAGFGHCGSHGGHGGLFTMLHKHIQGVHRHHHRCQEHNQED